MKKLMVAAAIVCAAAFAQAATCTWGFGSGADEYADDFMYEGTAVLFFGTVGETSNGDGTYTLDFSKASIATDGDGNKQITGQDGSAYTFGKPGYDNAVSLDAFSADGGDKFSLLLLPTDGIEDFANYEGDYFLYTATSKKEQDKTSLDMYVFMEYQGAVGSGDWKTAAAAPVPEPTSGLLLLLGVAGLALKRRRA